jgi:hypothetical protein
LKELWVGLVAIDGLHGDVLCSAARLEAANFKVEAKEWRVPEFLDGWFTFAQAWGYCDFWW